MAIHKTQAELEIDSERLDWLLENCDIGWRGNAPLLDHDNTRDMIDDIMAQARPLAPAD